MSPTALVSIFQTSLNSTVCFSVFLILCLVYFVSNYLACHWKNLLIPNMNYSNVNFTRSSAVA